MKSQVNYGHCGRCRRDAIQAVNNESRLFALAARLKMRIRRTVPIRRGAGFLCLDKRIGGCKLPVSFNDDEPLANVQTRSEELLA